MIMQQRTAIVMACVLIGGLSVSRVVDAASEAHKGALCAAKLNSTSIVGFSPYGVHNTSNTQTANVTCGTIVDASARSDVRAGVYDRHPSQDVCCTALWQNTSGDVLAFAQDCSSGVATAVQLLSMAVPSTLMTIGTMECTIPPTSINGNSHLSLWVLN
jgi:hypothetical protein